MFYDMRFTVGRKIGFGFVIVGLLMLAVFTTTIYIVTGAQDTLEGSIEFKEQYTEAGFPTAKRRKKNKEAFYLRGSRTPKPTGNTSTRLSTA